MYLKITILFCIITHLTLDGSKNFILMTNFLYYANILEC